MVIHANEFETKEKQKLPEITNKHWKTHAKGNDIITYVISANQHFISHWLFFQRCSCKLSFLFPPHHQSAPECLLPGYQNLSSINLNWVPYRLSTTLYQETTPATLVKKVGSDSQSYLILLKGLWIPFLICLSRKWTFLGIQITEELCNPAHQNFFRLVFWDLSACNSSLPKVLIRITET